MGERARCRFFICGKQRAKRVTEAEFAARLFYSLHSFISPEITIHTPDARIAASGAPSRKSHCFFFESLLFQLAFVCNAMTRRAPTQNTRRPLMSGGYEQHLLTSYGVGQSAIELSWGMENECAPKIAANIGAGCFPLTRRHYLK